MIAGYEIIDIGVNLAHRSFQRDRNEVIARAMAAGVQTMIVTGTSLKASEEALHLARTFPNQLFARPASTRTTAATAPSKPFRN